MTRSGPGKRRAGVATVEAVIALPSLALILAAILYVGHAAHRKQRLLAQARDCAWQFALAGCQDRTGLPQACQAALSPVRGEGKARDLLADDVPEGLLDQAIEMPVLGDFLEQLVGRNVRAHLSDTRERPALLGGSNLRTDATRVVLCNTVPAKAELFDTLFDKYWVDANNEVDDD